MRKMGGKYLAKKKLTSRQDTKDQSTCQRYSFGSIRQVWRDSVVALLLLIESNGNIL